MVIGFVEDAFPVFLGVGGSFLFSAPDFSVQAVGQSISWYWSPCCWRRYHLRYFFQHMIHPAKSSGGVFSKQPPQPFAQCCSMDMRRFRSTPKSPRISYSLSIWIVLLNVRLCKKKKIKSLEFMIFIIEESQNKFSRSVSKENRKLLIVTTLSFSAMARMRTPKVPTRCRVGFCLRSANGWLRRATASFRRHYSKRYLSALEIRQCR